MKIMNESDLDGKYGFQITRSESKFHLTIQ